MICPKCGGNISINENCTGCHTPYADLINSIRHDEMRQLFSKIENKIKNHESFLIEESLLACELLNSSLLVPLSIKNGEMDIMSVQNIKRKKFILLFTDRDEYDKAAKSVTPRTNPFRMILDLMDDNVDGFVINVMGEGCELSRKFLERYFLGDDE